MTSFFRRALRLSNLGGSAFTDAFASRLIAAALAAAAPAASWAQSLPPIYDSTPVALMPATTVVEFPSGTFLENIAIDAAGRLVINSYLDGKVYRIDAKGGRSEWTRIDGTIAGIALNPDGSALISGWLKGKEPAVFTVSPEGGAAIC